MNTDQKSTAAKEKITWLHQQMLARWNQQDATAIGELYAADANVIGFDGSQMNGSAEIVTTLADIFAHHKTATYVGKVREVRLLSENTAILRAVVGMIPPGGSDINPAVNAIQSLVAVKEGDTWKIALFHNTPAAFHGHPEASEALTAELRQLLQQ
ncbi:MAG: SgcJ/EcaC family oxidoreductase [Caldilineaceae bacterium]